MSLHSAYDLATGVFTGRQVSGDMAGIVALNARPGEAWFVGPCDPLRQRVAVEAGAEPGLVDYMPPPPAASGWEWVAAQHRWQLQATPAALAAAARAQRDHLLAQCDWVTARALDLGQPVPAAWASYRQALRDVTGQPSFPSAIEWPTPPA